jgi:hypothetical protein
MARHFLETGSLCSLLALLILIPDRSAIKPGYAAKYLLVFI